MCKQGLPFKKADKVEDLGVGTKGGKARDRQTIRKRTEKAKARITGIRTLRKADAKAKAHQMM